MKLLKKLGGWIGKAFLGLFMGTVGFLIAIWLTVVFEWFSITIRNYLETHNFAKIVVFLLLGLIVFTTSLYIGNEVVKLIKKDDFF